MWKLCVCGTKGAQAVGGGGTWLWQSEYRVEGGTEAETVVMAIVRTERAAKEAELEVDVEEEGGQPQLCASTHWRTEHYELKLFSLQQQQEQ